jgi:hypothetical protein
VPNPVALTVIFVLVGVVLIIGGVLNAATCNAADTLFYIGLGVLLLSLGPAFVGFWPVTAFGAPIGLIILAVGAYFLSAGSCTLIPF